MTYDPKWTHEQAVAAKKAWEADGDARVGVDPYLKWLSNQLLEDFRQPVEQGQGWAILEALSCCAKADLAMPDWLSLAFIDSYQSIVTRYENRSWDEVFGNPIPKGVQLKALRFRRDNAFAIYDLIQNSKIENPAVRIDKGLFEEIGEIYGVSGTLISDCYYEYKSYIEGDPNDPENIRPGTLGFFRKK
ncbi:MAG: hypothetical protein AB7U63_09135 [Porticoccaceae bacterium]